MIFWKFRLSTWILFRWKSIPNGKKHDLLLIEIQISVNIPGSALLRSCREDAFEFVGLLLDFKTSADLRWPSSELPASSLSLSFWSLCCKGNCKQPTCFSKPQWAGADCWIWQTKHLLLSCSHIGRMYFECHPHQIWSWYAECYLTFCFSLRLL